MLALVVLVLKSLLWLCFIALAVAVLIVLYLCSVLLWLFFIALKGDEDVNW